MSDDIEEVRDYTQRIRKKMVTSLMPNDDVPNDPDSQRVILTALNDMDKNDISHKRLKQDDKRNNNDAIIADLVTAILKDPLSNYANSVKATGPSVVDQDHKPLMENIEVVEGELDIGTHDLTYNTLVGK